MPDKPTNTPKPETAARGLTGKHVALIVGSLAVVCAAVVTVVMLTRPADTPPPVTTPTGNLVVDENNVETIGDEVQEKVDQGMFETHMNTTWSFPDGTSPSTDAVMGNAASNNYPFWFEVTLKDTGEVVYSSSLLPVGTVMKEIVLSQDLDAGTYAAVVSIHLVDENDEPIESSAGFNITLIVEN